MYVDMFTLQATWISPRRPWYRAYAVHYSKALSSLYKAFIELIWNLQRASAERINNLEQTVASTQSLNNVYISRAL